MRLELIGLIVVGVLFLLWALPAFIGMMFSGLWWLVTLPFRFLRLVVVDGLGGLLSLLWRLFSGFFVLFGWVGAILMWLVLAVAAVFGVMTLLSKFSGNSK